MSDSRRRLPRVMWMRAHLALRRLSRRWGFLTFLPAAAYWIWFALSSPAAGSITLISVTVLASVMAGLFAHPLGLPAALFAGLLAWVLLGAGLRLWRNKNWTPTTRTKLQVVLAVTIGICTFLLVWMARDVGTLTPVGWAATALLSVVGLSASGVLIVDLMRKSQRMVPSSATAAGPYKPAQNAFQIAVGWRFSSPYAELVLRNKSSKSIVGIDVISRNHRKPDDTDVIDILKSLSSNDGKVAPITLHPENPMYFRIAELKDSGIVLADGAERELGKETVIKLSISGQDMQTGYIYPHLTVVEDAISIKMWSARHEPR